MIGHNCPLLHDRIHLRSIRLGGVLRNDEHLDADGLGTHLDLDDVVLLDVVGGACDLAVDDDLAGIAVFVRNRAPLDEA